MSEMLNFTKEKYFQYALREKKEGKYGEFHTPADAFLLCIKDISFEDLDNLCKELKKHFDNVGIGVTLEDCYELTQGKDTSIIKCDDEVKKSILATAYQCVEKDVFLGLKTINDEKINTSSWLSHSLLEGKLARELALMIGINGDIAQTLGILHDIGRKKSHSFMHTIHGYEYLIDEGWTLEADCCLTHSFLPCPDEEGKMKGSRCANCDPALEGFYVDSYDNPQWENGTQKDDMTKYLETHEYNMYEIILNIADLMATDKKIVSPLERVEDIATRKTPDSRNRSYFKTSFIKTMLSYLYMLGDNGNLNMYENVNPNDNNVDEGFSIVSELFFNEYLEKKDNLLGAESFSR